MGKFINLGNESFKDALNDEYVDKTGLISVINDTLFKKKRLSCVTRCRRFGKSMAAETLCAYYDRSCNSRELFHGLEIESHVSFEEHLNKYPVLYLDMTTFITKYGHDEDISEKIQSEVMDELLETYPEIALKQNDDIMDLLIKINDKTGDQFMVIIDEWDAICREFEKQTSAMDKYVNLLRRMFKSPYTDSVFVGVYMTGILPIKKFKTESALNNFREYSMVQPGKLASYYGFTRSEVKMLCEKHKMDYNELAKWYDGYNIGNEPSMFNPSSVMRAIDFEECDNYWASTGAFDAVTRYIKLDYDGLKGDVVKMLAGEHCAVNVTGFKNDPNEIKTKDDALTILIHLGYLAYDKESRKCYVPNLEVAGELQNAIQSSEWKEVMDALNASDKLLASLLEGDAESVAAGVEKVHMDNVSILEYNDENSLSCVINLAFYAARNKYKIVRELPTGKGFADVVFVPWRNNDSPAIIVELKWKKDAITAISQIHERQYPDSLKEFAGEVVLCGINYDKESKLHTCVIERV